MAARVLVTGALGNVGQHVVRACLAGGFEVRAAGAAEKVQHQWPAAQACTLDFTQPTTWPAALQDVDHVFLLRPPPLGNMATTLIPFVDAAYAAGVKHIVFLSVAGADKKSWVPHRKVEDHLQHTGTSWTILRPGFFAQNLGDAYRQDIVEDDRLFVPAGQGRVAFLDVADVGDVVCTILADHVAHQGRAYLLAGPQAVTNWGAGPTTEHRHWPHGGLPARQDPRLHVAPVAAPPAPVDAGDGANGAARWPALG